jgi:class 3 adenylate cyclase
MNGMEALPRGTVTFLFTDIEGSTELTRRLGAGFGDVRAAHRRLVRDAVAAHAGHEIDTEGDGFFAAFDRASDAVTAAVAAQCALVAATWPEGVSVAVRMGLHTAEPYLHADGYIGVGVSRAARICAAAQGGQILLSHATAGVVEDLDLPGLRLRDLGQYRLKDIQRPQRLVQVDVDGLPTEFGPLRATGRARSVATLVLTDVSSWRRIMTTLGDDAAAALAVAYHRTVVAVVREHSGVPQELLGDNTLSLFDTAKDAVLAALAVRDALRGADWFPSELSAGVRVAVHTGRVSDPDAGQLGTPAIRASRLCDAAEPSQVLVSHSTHALVEGESLEGVELRDLGERELPCGERVRVYEAVASTAG